MWILLRSSIDKSSASSISLELKYNFLLNKCFQCFERHRFFSLLPEYNSQPGKFFFWLPFFLNNFARLFILILTQGEFGCHLLFMYICICINTLHSLDIDKNSKCRV